MEGIDWAKNALINDYSITPPCTFIYIYTASDAAWIQEHLQNKLANQFDNFEPKTYRFGIKWSLL